MSYRTYINFVQAFRFIMRGHSQYFNEIISRVVIWRQSKPKAEKTWYSYKVNLNDFFALVNCKPVEKFCGRVTVT
jgi:hypothetical protein